MTPLSATDPLLETRLPLATPWRRGKVRDVYDLGDRLLIVATDRISAYDVVLPTGIPQKGTLLTQLSLYWFRLLRDLVPNHVLTSDPASYDEPLRANREQLEGRSMLVRKAEPVPVECVVRGYLAGSGWADYHRSGEVSGVRLPAGLRESERLAAPIFTPATKATHGHDENISFAQMERVVGPDTAARLRELSLALYERGRTHAERCGLILADTKFEFGIHDGRLMWIDEAFTPDSSRFWPLAAFEAGRAQPSFDKQYVRDYLNDLGWDRRPPGPPLPPDVVRQTRERYHEAYRRITGSALP